jgi:hypothetical protein
MDSNENAGKRFWPILKPSAKPKTGRLRAGCDGLHKGYRNHLGTERCSTSKRCGHTIESSFRKKLFPRNEIVSMPVSYCSLVVAIDEQNENAEVLGRMRYNLECGHFSVQPCWHLPLCRSLTPLELDTLWLRILRLRTPEIEIREGAEAEIVSEGSPVKTPEELGFKSIAAALESNPFRGVGDNFREAPAIFLVNRRRI